MSDMLLSCRDVVRQNSVVSLVTHDKLKHVGEGSLVWREISDDLFGL